VHLTSRLAFVRRRFRDERGFTMYAVMGAMLAIMMLSVAAFAAAGGDLRGARRDQDSKRAYSAAEAGLNDYLSKLNKDNTYWAKCDQVPAPGVVNPYNKTPLTRLTIPNSDAQYAVEVLPTIDPSTGQRYSKCDKNNPNKTMLDGRTGTFQIRSTGFARGTRRSVIGTFRRKKFLDYLYFTDLETANPVAYSVWTGGNATTPDIQDWASTNCSDYYRAGRGSASYSGEADDPGPNPPVPVKFGCVEINFITGDSIDGPLHTNDQMLICGTPRFGRNGNDSIEASDPQGWRGNGGCAGSNPNFVGKYVPGAGGLSLPPSNSQLKNVVDPGYTFTGRTTVEFVGNKVKVNGNLMSIPPEGVIYVQNGPNCGVFYDPTATDPSQTPTDCGDAYVHGSYSSDVTVAAEKDIVVDGDIVKSADNMVGLIANNFVRINHPVTNRKSTYNGSSYNWSCSNNGSTPHQIDAAILALSYSLLVDNWYCGAALGTLTVNGAIAQKYRGIVGTFGANDTGYLKDYNYDDRLKYREPPHFLDPVETAWRIVRENEQTPAAGP
jgi:Tfp pilus assembly protein PilX